MKVFEVGTAVRVKKLATSPNPDVEADSWEEHAPGSPSNKGSIPVEYEVEGTLAFKPEPGLSLVINRTKRNGVEISGVMTTSVVTKITPDGFETRNSVYEMEVI